MDWCATPTGAGPTHARSRFARLHGFAGTALWAALLASCGGPLSLSLRPAVGMAPLAVTAIARAREGADLGCGAVTWSVSQRERTGLTRVWSTSPGSLCVPGEDPPELVSCGLLFVRPGAYVARAEVAGVGSAAAEVEVR